MRLTNRSHRLLFGPPRAIFEGVLWWCRLTWTGAQCPAAVEELRVRPSLWCIHAFWLARHPVLLQ